VDNTSLCRQSGGELAAYSDWQSAAPHEIPRLTNNPGGCCRKDTRVQAVICILGSIVWRVGLRRVWQIFFGRKRRAESPRVSEIRRPVRNDFHTVVTKTGLSVTFKPTNSIYSFVTDNPDIARLGPVSFVGVQHARSNTEAYNSGEVEAAAHQVATEHASIHFCHFID
jgi:hypothetical protein